MKLIKPSVAYWEQRTDMFDHIARCIRLQCNATSLSVLGGDQRACEKWWNHGDRSVFRHWAYYFIIPRKAARGLRDTLSEFLLLPQVCYYEDGERVCLSVTAEFVREHASAFMRMGDYAVSTRTFVACAVGNDEMLGLVRLTLSFTLSVAQISSFTAALVPCHGGVTVCDWQDCMTVLPPENEICVPGWYGEAGSLRRWLTRTAWRTEFAIARLCHLANAADRRIGLMPQDMAGRAVVTLAVGQWRCFLKRLSLVDSCSVFGSLAARVLNDRLRFYSATLDVTKS